MDISTYIFVNKNDYKKLLKENQELKYKLMTLTPFDKINELQERILKLENIINSNFICK